MSEDVRKIKNLLKFKTESDQILESFLSQLDFSGVSKIVDNAVVNRLLNKELIQDLGNWECSGFTEHGRTMKIFYFSHTQTVLGYEIDFIVKIPRSTYEVFKMPYISLVYKKAGRSRLGVPLEFRDRE